MDVVSHGYGVLGGAGMKVMVGKLVGQYQEGLFTCRGMPEHFPSVR